ncbi:MAG: N-acetylmuramoyl-L-alanine amidase [Vicinamibacterales bacterium]
MAPIRRIAALVPLVALLGGASPAWAQTAQVRYERALEREGPVRARLERSLDPTAAERTATLREVTRLVTAYEAIVRRFPRSGYSDNALWQGAGLAEAAYRRFARADDHTRAITLYGWLIREYPSSPYVRRARAQVAGLEQARSVEAALPRAPAASPEPAPPAGGILVPTLTSAAPDTAPSMSSVNSRALLSSIQRAVLPNTVRVTLQLDREVPYHEERISDPDRVFFDLRNAQLAPELADTTLTYPDDIVRQVRTGRHPNGTVRVVMDLDGVSRHSVFTLYNPFRLVIDFERSVAVPARQATVTVPERTTSGPASDASGVAADPAPVPAATVPAPPVATRADTPAPASLPVPAVAEPPAAPAQPASNAAGGYSLSRQLGLSVSRIVIDPGHGGRDPGSMAHGIREADLTLDVALRLEALLQKEPGIEVVLTRRTNAYVPLEERTAIANRESADLFLSIHANASRNVAARGVETYYLSFASSPDAEAVAARENSASERAMHNLPDIIKAIALNNKLDESKDLAAMVQETMVTRLRRANRNLRNLGVKKAPFVVLIGAGMPSVLAEMSFLTNRQEAQLLKTAGYKQRIAEALHEAVMRYRRSLKRQSTIADVP